MTDCEETALRAFEASFRAEGFMSPWITKVIPEYRDLTQGPFIHAEDLNRLTMALALENDEVIVGRSTHDTICLGYRTFLRAVSAFQGAIILAERGMDAEADTLTRGIYEAGFWIGYLWREGDAAREAIVADEKANKRSLYKVLLDDPEASATDKTMLEDAIAELGDARSSPIKELAKKSGFDRHYRFYRELSATSAHVSLHSLHRYVNRQPDGTYKGHIFGPNPDALYLSLWYACDAMRVCVAGFIYLLGGTSRDDEFRALLDRHHEDFPHPKKGR